MVAKSGTHSGVAAKVDVAGSGDGNRLTQTSVKHERKYSLRRVGDRSAIVDA